MKFGEQLAASLTPEWRTQYINYEDLRAYEHEHDLRARVEEALMDKPTRLKIYVAQFEEKFFAYSKDELKKVDTFFNEKLAEAQRKLLQLRTEIQTFVPKAEAKPMEDSFLHRMDWFSQLVDKDARRAKRQYRRTHDLKMAFSEYYLSLILLQNFQNLNATAFRKILKKHDKILNTDTGMTWRIQNVEITNFYLSKEVDRLIMDTETVVTANLESGNRAKAMQRLRVPPINEQAKPSVFFLMGLFLGIFVVLVINLLVAGFVLGLPRDVYMVVNSTTQWSNQVATPVDWRIIVRLYRGPFLIIIHLFLFAVNVHGWRAAGVNHVLIFELDPRNHLSQYHIAQLATFFGVLWSCSVLAFFHSDYVGIPHYIIPLVLPATMLVLLLNPFRFLFYNARKWFLRTLWHVVCSPFHSVVFADFWLADQFISQVQAFQDIQYLICFYCFEVPWVNNGEPLTPGICTSTSHGIRPILAALPSWFRFAQCFRRYWDSKLIFPHLVNAGKYTFTYFVVFLATLNALHSESFKGDAIQERPVFYMWMVLMIVNSFSSFLWDLKMDFGFLDRKAKHHRFLRDSLVYSSTRVYYGAIGINFVLRFARAFSISTDMFPFPNQEILTTFLAIFELCRRCMWNFFRLENEHLNNCGAFRAVRDFSTFSAAHSEPKKPSKTLQVHITSGAISHGASPDQEAAAGTSDHKAELFPLKPQAERKFAETDTGAEEENKGETVKAELFPIRNQAPALGDRERRRSLFPLSYLSTHEEMEEEHRKQEAAAKARRENDEHDSAMAIGISSQPITHAILYEPEEDDYEYRLVLQASHILHDMI